MPLNTIAQTFGLGHAGSVSPAIRDIKREFEDVDSGLAKKTNRIIKSIGIIKYD